MRKGGFREGRIVEQEYNKRPSEIISLPFSFSLSLSDGFPGRVSVSRPFFHFRHFCPIFMRTLSFSLFFFPFCFHSSLSFFSKQHDFLPSIFAAFPAPVSLAQPSFLPFSLDPGSSPPAPIHAAPNLNPIFHITSRKSYSAVLGGATRRTALARRNDGTFLSSLCFLSLLPLSSLSHSSFPSCRPK